jgi:hypothetical protein
MRKQLTNVEWIVIHCSASDNKNHDDISVIKEWHLARGFDDVGYQWFITSEGVLQEGRSMNEVGAHTYGVNEKSWGICLSGEKNFTAEQAVALIDLLVAITTHRGEDTGLSEHFKIVPHYEFTNKGCPNFRWDKLLQFVPELRNRLGGWGA